MKTCSSSKACKFYYIYKKYKILYDKVTDMSDSICSLKGH